MARNDVYLNINAASPADAVVTAQQDMTARDFPELVLGDAPLFNFYFTDNTASWPSWAGNASYSVAVALSDAVAQDITPLAYTTNVTAITGGWSVRLPVNTERLVGSLCGRRFSQEYPVLPLWLQIRVADSSGNPVTYAAVRTNVRMRAISDSQPVSDDPTPTGTQHVLANADGTLFGPTTFFRQLTSHSAQANASGNTVASFGTYAVQHVEIVTVSGSGGTTRVLSLPTTGRVAGHVAKVRFMCPATASITLEVRNATAAGTLLLSASTDGSGDDVAAEFYFDGTAWQPFEAQFAT